MATQESNPWENLPDDLITQIFLLLPIKSLFRFRSVSKSWLSLISSPQFKKTLLKNPTSGKRLMYISPTAVHTISICPKFDADPSVDKVPYNYAWKNFRIVGSCNGLVCLALREDSIVVWNPTTRKHRQIRIPVYVSCDDFLWTCYGFGYDASSDDYKVVGLNSYKRESQLTIYSLRDDSWKWSDWSDDMICGSPGVFVNGAIHLKYYYRENVKDWDVVAQSLTTGDCSSVALPVRPKECPFEENCWLGVSGERLCVCFRNNFSMDVWVMMEYGVNESWSKVVCFPDFFCINDYILGLELLHVMENGGILMKDGWRLIMYRPFECRQIRYAFHNKAITYTESDVSPDLVVKQTSD